MLIIEALGNPEYVGTTITDTSSFQTSQVLRDKYVEYNRRFFQGRLPVIPVELLEASRAGSRSAAFEQVPYYCGTEYEIKSVRFYEWLNIPSPRPTHEKRQLHCGFQGA